ncbi:Rv3235 family protein [Streptomyces sp. NBC_01465]|uniref:Rv3235 family protein n=1 Tax=Streptomyces sp. NBC_01465 TaxID=2903878 RepID=UPI002E352CA1|nr:Rv3235 family protein [Streptomyces sp. NBC_01465]
MTITRPANRRDQRRPGQRGPRPHELFAERLLAVLSGQKPVHWMLNFTVGEAYQQLIDLAPHTPFLNGDARPVLLPCRWYGHPRPGVVEAAVTITAGEHVSAMAFRLEQGADLRWRCAAVELGGERVPA